jgi:hypothetical protein
MVVTGLIALAAARPPLLLAALGLISGVLSAWVGFAFAPPWFRWPAELFFLDPETLAIGVLFAAAIAVGLSITAARGRVLPVAALATMYAWSAAIQTVTSITAGTSEDVRVIFGCLAAGAVGAGATQLGASLVLAELRRPSSLVLTTAVGALLALVYYAAERNLLDGRLLFVLWQPATAYCIGRGLGRRDGSAHAVLAP